MAAYEPLMIDVMSDVLVRAQDSLGVLANTPESARLTDLILWLAQYESDADRLLAATVTASTRPMPIYH